MQVQRSPEASGQATAPTGGPHLLRVKAVAALVDVHPSTVYRAIESGDLPAVRVGQSRGGLRVSPAAVDKWLTASQVRPSVPGVVVSVVDGQSDSAPVVAAVPEGVA